MMSFWQDFGDFALYAGAAVLAYLCVQYPVLAKWWRKGNGKRVRPTLEGIGMVGLASSIVIIYLPSLILDAGGPQFATTTWYFYLTVFTVAYVLVFACIMVFCWERVRWQRRKLAGGHLVPDLLRRRFHRE